MLYVESKKEMEVRRKGVFPNNTVCFFVTNVSQLFVPYSV